jgi:hypothetical protein
MRSKERVRSPRNTYVEESIPFQTKFNSNREIMNKMLLILTQMVFFQEIFVFLQLCSIDLLETK